MEFPVTFDTFKSRYGSLITAAQTIICEPNAAENLFETVVMDYAAMLAENRVIVRFGKAIDITQEERDQAAYVTSLGLASLFAAEVRQMNVENEFVPGYDGEDAGNNEQDIQGTHNTMFNAQFSQNRYGRKFLNAINVGGIPLQLAAC